MLSLPRDRGACPSHQTPLFLRKTYLRPSGHRLLPTVHGLHRTQTPRCPHSLPAKSQSGALCPLRSPRNRPHLRRQGQQPLPRSPRSRAAAPQNPRARPSPAPQPSRGPWPREKVRGSGPSWPPRHVEMLGLPVSAVDVGATAPWTRPAPGPSPTWCSVPGEVPAAPPRLPPLQPHPGPLQRLRLLGCPACQPCSLPLGSSPGSTRVACALWSPVGTAQVPAFGASLLLPGALPAGLF